MNFFPADLEEIVLRLCEDVATPRSLTVALMVRHRCFADLVSLRREPRPLETAYDFYVDTLVTDLLRKCSGLDTGIDTKAAALEKFWASEWRCKQTNDRLRSLALSLEYPMSHDDGLSRVAARILLTARKKIASILGACPAFPNGKFGPGATYGDRGQLTTVPDKMSSRPTLTSGAISHLFLWGGTAWASACAEYRTFPEYVPGNRFTTVPKDASTDRGICIEPSINAFYQLGYGSAIRTRLRRWGLDLATGQMTHRQVACEASISGSFATMDLSSASDTVSKKLVELLLPTDWFQALSDLRSPKTLVEDRWVYLEKFSSMGNGYTFELETLVFAALIWAASYVCFDRVLTPGKDLFAYGDDLIFPSDMGVEMSAVLTFFGFDVNSRKTFLSGPFRESCGGDFFRGVPVRAHFLKEIPHEPQSWIAFANGLARSYANFSRGTDLGVVRRAFLRTVDQLPSQIRSCRGPSALGDLCIHDSDPTRWNTKVRNSVRFVRVYKPCRPRLVRWDNFKPSVILASIVYGVNSNTQNESVSLDRKISWGGVTPRGAVDGYKLGWAPFS